METQVLSIEQMQELIKLDIDTSNARIWWIKSIEDSFEPELTLYTQLKHVHHLIGDIVVGGYELVPALTLQDILKMLPKAIYVDDTRTDKEEYIGLNYLRIGCPTMLNHLYLMYTKDMNMNSGWATFDAEESLINAAFNMLKWCKENNYI